MSLENFEKLFLERTLSLQLKIDNGDSETGSRIGGYPPLCFTESLMNQYHLNGYVYYFTLSNDIIDIIDGKEISVFIPTDFETYNNNYKYPDFPLKCIFHNSCERGTNISLCNKDIIQKKIISSEFVNDLEEVDDVDNIGEFIYSPVFGSKLGGTPSLLQIENHYSADLKQKDYQFVLQIDENFYLRNQIIGNSPFNDGMVYFYGKFEGSILVDFVPGFWQS